MIEEMTYDALVPATASAQSTEPWPHSRRHWRIISGASHGVLPSSAAGISAVELIESIRKKQALKGLTTPIGESSGVNVE